MGFAKCELISRCDLIKHAAPKYQLPILISWVPPLVIVHNLLQSNSNRPNACFCSYPRCVTLKLLRLCAEFCKLAHLACFTPSYLPSMNFLHQFDEDISCISADPAKQVQRCLHHGGLGLRSIRKHASISSVIFSLSSNQCDSLIYQH